MFFVRERPVQLDCFTSIPHVFDYAKISQNFKPDWFKKTPALINNGSQQTIKNCAAFSQFYKHGIVIPSWFELELTIGSTRDQFWCWESSTDTLQTNYSHSSDQFEGFAKGTGNNVKITSPWAFKTKDDINFLWSQPTWNMRNTLFNFCVLPGVVEFKKQHATNINLFIEYQQEKQFCKIPSLNPLVILHPLTEKKIEIKNHLVSENEIKRIKEGITHLYFNRNFLETLKNKRKILKKVFDKNT